VTGHSINPHIFRAYDVRGVVDVDLTPELVFDLGRAVGSEIRAAGGDRAAVGRDCRTHSPRLSKSLIGGLATTGVSVIDIGVAPTPLLYFAVHHHDLGGGIMITGSHNPPEYNGFKILVGRDALHSEAIQGLRRRIEAGDHAVGDGSVELADALPVYLDHLVKAVRPASGPLRVVVDAGNGTAGPVAPAAYRLLGHTVEELYCRMDGTFPHHHPDPSDPKNLEALAARVGQVGADIGFAFDGDADRLGVVDAEGRIVAADRLLALLARAVLAERPGATIVSEVKCSQVMYDDIRAHGGKAIMGRVGHSYIKAGIKETNAALAGELSGHLFFNDRWYGFDDAVYAGARVLELLTTSGASLAELLDDLPPTHATPEIRLECPDERKFAVVEAVRQHFAATHEVIDIDGARVIFEGGWGLVRASNTQPALILRVEADSPQRLGELRATVEQAVSTAMDA
jgi:phosphomannomutase/phosphoglucomutase